jgi:hypothetical protein
MSSELLLELPGKIVKSCALPQSTGPHLKLALLVVQTDSISIIHVRNAMAFALTHISHDYVVCGRETTGASIITTILVGNPAMVPSLIVLSLARRGNIRTAL